MTNYDNVNAVESAVASPLHHMDFAQEVRAERLALLWKVTLVLVVFLVWGALILTSLQTTSVSDLVFPTIATVIGCLLCRTFLQSDRSVPPVWAYILGVLFTIALLTHTSTGTPLENPRQIVMFIYPIIILIVGFLLPLGSTLIVLALGIVLTIFSPYVGQPDQPFVVSSTQSFAIVLQVLAAGVASQMSGTMYGIAEWALESYRKERETKDQLFDTQQEIQRSYMRQKALAEQLQDTNTELESVRASAIEAKNFRGQFLANMRHELRTPLNAIIGFI